MKTINKYKQTIIGIDQSYKNIGICIISDNTLKHLRNIDLHKIKTNTEKRNIINKTLNNILSSIIPKSDKVICIIERIRLFTKGFVNVEYIKSIGALNCVIIDICNSYNVPVYSVDTRCWKSQIVGTSKPEQNSLGIPPEKYPTIKWCIKEGYEKYILKDGKYDNDIADSCGIAYFGLYGDKDKLKLEK